MAEQIRSAAQRKNRGQPNLRCQSVSEGFGIDQMDARFRRWYQACFVRQKNELASLKTSSEFDSRTQGFLR